MKSVAAVKSHARMWDSVKRELIELSLLKYKDEEKKTYITLFVAVIIRAIKDDCLEFFISEQYMYYCELLKLNHKFVTSLLIKAKTLENSGEIWEAPSSDINEERE